MHFAVRYLVVCLIALGFIGCASLRFGGAAALKIDCDVPDAALYVDEVFLGRAAAWSVDGRFIKAGLHRFELRHPDYFTHYEEQNLERGDAVLLRIRMHRQLD
ncbi:MAG: hypothetical protein SGI86_13890 [Deltaproteobacteria bacterium]|nr:hypothetical protein [Deltaproteobacteria bacterium]